MFSKLCNKSQEDFRVLDYVAVCGKDGRYRDVNESSACPVKPIRPTLVRRRPGRSCDGDLWYRFSRGRRKGHRQGKSFEGIVFFWGGGSKS